MSGNVFREIEDKLVAAERQRHEHLKREGNHLELILKAFPESVVEIRGILRENGISTIRNTNPARCGIRDFLQRTIVGRLEVGETTVHFKENPSVCYPLPAGIQKYIRQEHGPLHEVCDEL